MIFLSKTFNNQIYEQINKLIFTKLNKTFLTLFILGVLCNILVCLAVLINHSSKNILEKILIPILPVSLFVLCGFEHSIADMFYISIIIVHIKV
jgi:formate/nitrite transporter FocA (FNT family)